MLSVRLERCAVQEAAAISMNVRAAEADFDEAREAEVDALFETIGENPATAVRRLLRMPEGVDRMLDDLGRPPRRPDARRRLALDRRARRDGRRA